MKIYSMSEITFQVFVEWRQMHQVSASIDAESILRTFGGSGINEQHAIKTGCHKDNNLVIMS
jgi:hypothetical protein